MTLVRRSFVGLGRTFSCAALVLAGSAIGVIAQARPGDPVLVQSSRMDVLIGSPAVRDPVADRARITALIAGCRRTMRIAEADSAAVAASEPPIFTERGANGGSTVVFSVLHSEGLQANCGDRLLQSTVLAVTGVRITYDTSYAADRDVARVSIKRGEETLVPLAERREPVRRLGPDGFQAPRTQWIRLAVDLARLTPAADGRVDDLVMEVHTASGGEPDRFAIPWSALRVVWESMLEVRTLTNATGTAPKALPAPGDEQLHLAHQAYERNDLLTAARLGARRLLSEQLRESDRTQGRAQLGLAFAGLGDTAAARVVFSRLVEEQPCFALAVSAPSAARALVGGIRRPGARCTAQSMTTTILRSALLPGFGRPVREGDVPLRAGMSAVVMLAGAGALYSRSQANSYYDDYLAFQVRPDLNTASSDATRLFEQAESARVRGLTLWAVAGALWGGQLVSSVVQEHRHAKRLDAVTRFGGAVRPRDVSLAPLLTTHDVGLSLSLRW